MQGIGEVVREQMLNDPEFRAALESLGITEEDKGIDIGTRYMAAVMAGIYVVLCAVGSK